MNRLEKGIFLFVGIMFALSAPAFAVGSGGYENASFSAKGLAMGNAFVAQSDDPSAVAFNPAGLTDVPGLQLQGGTSLFNPYLHYKGKESNAGLEAAGKRDLVWAPTGFVTYQFPWFDKRFSFGFGMTAPFGLITEYSSTGPLRYAGYYNSLRALAYSLEGAARLTDKTSIGGGFVIYDSEVKQYAKLNLAAYGAPDGLLRLRVSGQGWGWNIGIKHKLAPKHTIGAYYRSAVRTRMRGSARVDELNSAAVGTLPVFFSTTPYETRVGTDYTYPWNVTVGYLYEPTQKWKIETDLGVTGWSSSDRQEFNLGEASPLSALSPAAKDWRNVLSIHVGTEYKFSEHFKGRAGYIFFQTPQSDGNWTPDVADNTRHAPTVGFGWDWKDLTVDFAYSAIIYEPRNVSRANDTSAPVDGNYRSFTNQFMLTFTLKDLSFLNKPFKKFAKFNDK
jgi:long-chain fatty acid transport protein